MLEEMINNEAGLQERTRAGQIYIPQIRGVEAGRVAGYLENLKTCWQRLEALQQSETEKALCRMQQRKLELRIGLWKEAFELDRRGGLE